MDIILDILIPMTFLTIQRQCRRHLYRLNHLVDLRDQDPLDQGSALLERGTE